MKYLLLLILFLKFFEVNSATILLTEPDSIVNPLRFSNKAGKIIYGRSAVFTSSQKEFIIGIFDDNSNDSLDALDVVSISELKGNTPTLFKYADKLNSNYVEKLKFIIIAGNAYKINLATLNEVIIERTQMSGEIRQYNFIDCLLTLSQFESILIDSVSAKIDSTSLANFTGKTTIIYYTASHCAPCEKLKPIVTELLSSKRVNLIIISNNLDSANKDFKTYKNRYYFDGMADPSKVRNHGFPQIIVFDKNGKFVESDNGRKREELFRKYAFSN